MEYEHYVPTPQVLDRLTNVTFAAVVGPSAAGKTTLIREAARREPLMFFTVLNHTSRDPRPDEQAGVDFRFESRARMEEGIMRHEYVQVAPTVFGDLYATAAKDYSTKGVAVLPVLADAIPSFRALPFKVFRTVFVLPPDWQTWQRRLQEHHFTTDKLMKRYIEAQRSLEFALTDQQTRFVINRDLEAAIDDFITLTLDQRLSERLQADQAQAPEIVRNLLNELEQALRDPATK
jgi:guanylate kinase